MLANADSAANFFKGWVLNFFQKRAAKKRILASGLFDPEFYLQYYPDVAAAGLDPLDHFLKNGGRESRSPSRKFDGPYYVLSNPEAARADNILLDWLREGKKGRRVPPVPLAEPTAHHVHAPAIVDRDWQHAIERRIAGIEARLASLPLKPASNSTVAVPAEIKEVSGPAASLRKLPELPVIPPKGEMALIEQKLAARSNEIAKLTIMLADESANRSLAMDGLRWMQRLHLVTESFPGWWALLPAASRRKRELRLYRHEGVFDAAKYLAEHPDVAAQAMDPLRHYILHGITENRSLTI